MALLPIIVRITAQPRKISDGSLATLRFAGGGDRAPYNFGGVAWRSGVVSIPKFRAALGWDDNGWNGSVVPDTGKISWAPSMASDYASYASSYHWKDAPVTVEVGLEKSDGTEPASWTTLLTGTIADISAQDGQLDFSLADLSHALHKPANPATFAGTGGIEGPSEIEGRPKRLAFGRVYNVEGLLIDKANSIYCFSDPAYPLQGMPVLRDMGRSASPAPTTLAWQGSIAATFAALQTAVAAQGSGVIAPSIGCCKWWTVPAGPLTADLLGIIGSGYAETCTGIVQRLSERAAGPTVAAWSAAITAAKAGSAPAGLFIPDDKATFAQAIDRLLLGAGCTWGINAAGQIELRLITLSNPVELLKSDSVRREQVLPPVITRKLGYQRNERQHSDSEIAITVPEELGGEGSSEVVWLSSYSSDPAKLQRLGKILRAAYDSATPAFDLIFHSGVGYQEGFQLEALISRMPLAGGGSYLGMDDAADTPAAGSLTYSIFFNPTGTASYNESGTTGTLGSFALGDTWAIIGDGSMISYLKNGIAVRTIDRIDQDTNFRAVWIAKLAGEEITIQRFGPAMRNSPSWMPRGSWGADNLIHMESWRQGRTLNSPGLDARRIGSGYYLEPATASAGAQSLALMAGPIGAPEPVLQTTGKGVQGDGGFIARFGRREGFSANRTYRFLVWIYNPSGSAAATLPFYFGLGPCENLGGSNNSNPYFLAAQNITQRLKWFLAVGVLHAQGSNVSSSGVSGLYDPATGERLIAGTDFRSDATDIEQYLRAFNYVTNSNVPLLYFGRPEVSEVRPGTTLSIAQILADARRTAYLGTNGRAYDGRLLPSSFNFGLRQLSDVPTVSDTATNASTCQIDISAFARYSDWGSTITYPAGTFTGKSYATKYFIWRNVADPTTSGESWGISTDITDALGFGKVYICAFTTRATQGSGQSTGGSGGSGGGGFDTDCVDENAIVHCRHGRIPARDVRPGMEIRALELAPDGKPTGNLIWAKVERNWLGYEGRILLTSASGVELITSDSAPLTLEDGSHLFGLECDGRELPILTDERGLFWEPCSAQRIAPGVVAHISAGGAVYAAGQLAAEAILTHNIYAKP